MITNETRTKNTSKGIVWGLIYKSASILLPFISRTIIIVYLGVEYTGLGSLFTSILQVLSLAELGVGHALVFSMYKPVAENDIESINAYMAFYKKCYRIIGVLILSLGILLVPFIPVLVKSDIPDGVNLYILYGIFLGNTVISYFLFSYKTSVIIASQRMDIINRVYLFCFIGQQIIQIILLIVFRNYYLFVIVIPLNTIINNLTINYIVKKTCPEIDCKGKLDQKEINVIKDIVSGMMFQKIGSVVLSSVDTVVISAFLGLRLLGIYNNYYYIIAALFAFLAIINNSVIPSVGNNIQTHDLDSNYSVFRLYSFMYSWVVIFCAACLLSLYQPFMRLWVGEKYLLDFRMVMLLTGYFVIWKIVDPVYVFRDASGGWKEYKFIPMLAAGINLISNIILVQIIGLYGIVISTMIAFIVIYVPFFSFPLFNTYFRSIEKYRRYLFDQIKTVLVAMIVVSATYFGTSWITGNSVIEFVKKAMLCFVESSVLLFLVYFRDNDFVLTKNFVENSIIKKLIFKG